MILKFKKLHDLFKLPIKANPGDAGWDMVSVEDVTIPLAQRKAVSLGCSVELLDGWELQVRPRSGLALKHGITVLNSPGTIDSGYRGELKVILINTSWESFNIKAGDRICQLVLGKVYPVEFELVDELSNTERGTGGFGSSGI